MPKTEAAKTTMAAYDTRVNTAMTIPATKINRGGRTLYQLTLTSNHVSQVLPTVPAQVVASAQRGYNHLHAKRIARFIVQHPDSWAFGAITLALRSDYLNFEPFEGLEEDSVKYGLLTLLPGSNDIMKILDGQHRRSAFQLIRDRGLGTNVSRSQYDAAQKSIDRSEISVDLYEINEEADARRVFNWMNTSLNVSAAERVYLDNTDPFNEAVQRITGSLSGRFGSDKIRWLAPLVIPLMDNEFRRKRQRVEPDSPYWMNAKQLRTLLVAYTVGRERVPAKIRDALKTSDIIAKAKQLFNDELVELRDEWQALSAGRIAPEQLSVYRERSLVFNPRIAICAGWTLGMLRQEHTPKYKLVDLAEQWHNMDLSYESPSRLLHLMNRDDPNNQVAMYDQGVRPSATTIWEAIIAMKPQGS